MAYSTSTPPALVAQRIGSGAPAVWSYSVPAADNNAAVVGAGYITNGAALGMEKGDITLAASVTNGGAGVYVASTVTAGGAATLTAVYTTIA